MGQTGRRAGVAALSVARAGATRSKSVVSALNSGAGEPVGLLVRVPRSCTPWEPMPTVLKGIEIPPHLRRTMHTLCNNMAPTDAHVKRHIGLDPGLGRLPGKLCWHRSGKGVSDARGH